MTIEFKLPELGENVLSATVSKVLVKPGDSVSVNQAVLEVETDKALAEIPCTAAGTIVEVRVKEGQTVKPGVTILVIEEGAVVRPPEAAPAAAPAPVAPPAPQPVPAAVSAVPVTAAPRTTGGPVLASPSVRRQARTLGVDLTQVPTADPAGRISMQDVLAFAQAKAPAAAPASTVAAPGAEAPEGGKDAHGLVEYEAMNMVRRKTAEHMTHSWTTIPHVTHFDKADVTELEALRKKYAKKIEAQGGRLTMICFVLKVLVAAFQRFPKFNASLDLEQQRILLKRYYNIGVAVDTPNGLLVPVIRNVDAKSLTELALELPKTAEKARARKLAIEDMQGGTFTVSNLGGLGGTGFTPIINAPEVALLGLSRSSTEAVYRDGAFVPRMMLPLSLSYDHRVIDGADAARFTRWVAEALESPWAMWMEE